MTPHSAAKPLSRLLRDTAGNTLAMMAAAMFPMVGLVGGAVDASRLYLVKTRLQQACDAGALAARRVMTGASVEADPNAMSQAQSFFSVNLANGAYGAQNVSLAVKDVRNGGTPAGNITGRVAGTAAADVPMTLMKVFGIGTVRMNAACEANLNVANNDVMFVLDLTGSMACTPAGGCSSGISGPNSAGNYFVPEVGGSKIQALRDAVSRFFTTLNSATPITARLRVGFVPYSVNVNLGDVLPLTALADSHKYQSREAFFNTPQYTPTSTATLVDQTYGMAITASNCDNYGNNVTFSQNKVTFTPSTPAGATDQPPTAPRTGGTTPPNETRTYYSKVSWTGTGGTDGTCVREVKTVTTSWSPPRYVFTSWRYGLVAYDTTRFKDRNNVVQLAKAGDGSVPTAGKYYNALQLATAATGATLTSSRWDGCIEERDANADIDLAATSDVTRWRPAWPDIEYSDSSGLQPNRSAYAKSAGGLYACTKNARKLDTMTQADVDAYVANAATNPASRFLPLGYTYHDIGMLWGTRLLSKNGVDAVNVNKAPSNARDVKRHIIFMTDGDMDPDLYAYGPYGIENLDKRIVGGSALTDANLTNLHNQRFLAACQAAKDRDISVWVVAFGQALTPQLTQCADSSAQAYQASNAAELETLFQQIAQKIADLRLSK